MAQLITKFGYLKDNKARSRGGYAKYIATREGVEAPGVEGYLKYMGTRPRVEKQGSHGLFTTAGEPVSSLSCHPRTGRSPGACLDLDPLPFAGRTPSGWALTPLPAGGICSAAQAGTLAEGLKIAPSHLKWYAAFHNEGHHPHVHSDRLLHESRARGSSPSRAWKRFARRLAQEIFRQDLVSVYERQTAHRDELRRVSREKVAGLVEEISGGAAARTLRWSRLLRELAQAAFPREGQEGVRLPAART